ncbi:hypothetical protein [Photorhabdus africana]|uniref:hypothetical protein n=1 Tax=Photorhabdus africana TaxID=3097554 RepID=UPI002B403F52|nr:hypothetical protein [Photorhabdus sp. CRI-LC]
MTGVNECSQQRGNLKDDGYRHDLRGIKIMTHHTNQAANKSKRLTVLTDAKQFALNTLPDFDEVPQLEFLSLSTRFFLFRFV